MPRKHRRVHHPRTDCQCPAGSRRVEMKKGRGFGCMAMVQVAGHKRPQPRFVKMICGPEAGEVRQWKRQKGAALRRTRPMTTTQRQQQQQQHTLPGGQQIIVVSEEMFRRLMGAPEQPKPPIWASVQAPLPLPDPPPKPPPPPPPPDPRQGVLFVNEENVPEVRDLFMNRFMRRK